MRRSLILNGFMATGKSSVGRALAELAQVEFVDLDERVEERAGKSISRIFAEDGESRFREFESATLRALLSDDQVRVLAVGGGALLEREARLAAAEKAVLITLSAALEQILSRAAQDGDIRPLLQSGSEAVARLLELRAPAYREAYEVVGVGDKSPAALAAEILEIWRRDPVGVLVGEESYCVEVGQAIAPKRIAECVNGASLAFVISDTTVDGLYGAPVREAIAAGGQHQGAFNLSPGEEHKNVESLSQIWDAALSAGADRKSWFVGLGGGVATDVAGFAAATWMRGVNWVSVPTTLLGMVDASVGGKTAIDLPSAKNCVGAFWQPSRVVCDTSYLISESERRYRSGLAEVVKTALLGDAEMFELLESQGDKVNARDKDVVEELVRRCVAVKARIVSRDVREGGLRAALNLGHTVGHALEALDGYGHLMHGEAVSLGLVAAMRLGVKLGIHGQELATRTERLLESLGLPVNLTERPLERAASLLANDKKRGGDQLRFVFCPEPGAIQFKKLALEELQELVCSLR